MSVARPAGFRNGAAGRDAPPRSLRSGLWRWLLKLLGGGGFKYAADGVVHVYRTQKHMRFHFFMLVTVLLFSKAAGLPPGEILILLLTISLVLIAEMFNTAIEAVVDLVTQSYHPLAKFAKDIAAGAVLMATLNALAVGMILFTSPRAGLPTDLGVDRPGYTTMVVVGLLLLLALVLIRKVAGGKGTLLRGGVVSGHTALGFFFTVVIWFVSPDYRVRAAAILLALLIAQSRVDAGIHTLREVVYGALLGTFVAATVCLFLP